MTSIARTFAVSLGIVATTIFLTLLGIVVWRYHAHARDSTCHAAAAILDRATVVDGRTLTIRPTSALEELKSDSPKLWYVVSYGDLVDEFVAEAQELPVVEGGVYRGDEVAAVAQDRHAQRLLRRLRRPGLVVVVVVVVVVVMVIVWHGRS